MEFEQIDKFLLTQSIEKGGTLKRILERIDSELSKYSWNIKKLRKYLRDTPGLNKSNVNTLVPRLTESECYKVAKLHTSAKDFRIKSPYEYDWASKNGWLSQYTWLTKNYEPCKHIKWTQETCELEAKKYQYKQDFKEQSLTAYRVASKNKWIVSYTWLQNREFTRNKEAYDWKVYVYEFQDSHSVYVGLTVDCKRRHYEHKSKLKDSLYKYCKANNIELPNYTVVEDNINAEESQCYEDLYINKYRTQGWNIINKAKTGIGSSSIGGNPKLIWTKETCREAASKCTYRNEFKLNYPRAYAVSCKNKWIEEFGLLLKPKYIPECTSKKAVLMFNLDGEFEMEFESTYVAGEFINPNSIQNGRKSISQCCNGNRITAYGHKWKFKE